LSLLALFGIGGAGWLGVSWWVALPFVGAVLAGVNPLGRPKKSPAAP